MSTLAAWRDFAVARSLFCEPDLRKALERLGFVQADPIRAPARAQDLILRQRVVGYRAGDLEAGFADLGLAEEMLHVYGFLPKEAVRLLHPRRRASTWQVEADHPHLRRAILTHLRLHGPTHPRRLSALLGSSAVVNAWGGQSAATTRMLEALQVEGRIEVVAREAGTRVYGLPAPRRCELSPARRAEGLVLLLTHLYAPVPEVSLRRILATAGARGPHGVDLREVLDRQLRRGRLCRDTVDGVAYVWPDGDPRPKAVPERVSLLAPFDPIVWDRRRFEHLWGWRYRFEAYTPAARRVLGYYALPLLWRSEVIGWANLTYRLGTLHAEVGYVGRAPRGASFRRALDEELSRMEQFLAMGSAPAPAPSLATR